MSTGSRKRSSKTARRFTRVQITNWRNFQSAGAELQRRAFLVGPNASGKSNFLDAFRFLHDLTLPGGGFQEAVRQRGGVSSLRCLAARRYSDITLKISTGDDDAPSAWTYELSFNQDKQKSPVIKREAVWRNGEQLLDRPDKTDQGDPARLAQTYLEQLHANQPFREIAEFLQSISYLHIVPQLVREPERSFGKAKNDPFGGDFLEQIARTPQKTRDAWLRRIRDALRLAVPQLQELELTRDERGTPHLRGKYEHWRPQGAWQTEGHFSDGTLRLLGLLWIALAGNGPLLLEEPELSLHPEVVRHIPSMFARIQQRTGRQILISTHSSDLLRDESIGLDEVLLLSPEREGTTVKRSADLDEVRHLLEGGASLAEAIMPRTAPPTARQLSLFGN